MTQQVVYEGQSSGDCVKSFFDLHIGYDCDVLDLTYGAGTFWRWSDGSYLSSLTLNDAFVDEGVEFEYDFRATPFGTRRFDVVVFDPPFTANGPSKDGHQKRYGADRSLNGAPQNIHEVRSLLASGLIEAMRLSRKWVLVKTQDVVESGRLHDSEGIVRQLFQMFGFRIVDYRLYESTRRPQPNAARGATQQHFYNRPSIFILAKRAR